MYGLLHATTPHAIILGVLLLSGCLRSLQFTSVGAISYADVAPEMMSAATSLASVVQQLAISVGVTVGAYALQVATWLHGSAHLDRADFQLAFFVVAVASASSVLWFRRLAADAGHELAGRAPAT
jgi:hypothetical protein